MDSLNKKAAVNDQSLYRKRHRTLRSCTECHRRKQKCNRLRPCQHCTNRAKPELCSYESNDNRDGQGNITSTRTAGSGEDTVDSSSVSHWSSLPETNPLSPQDHASLANVLGYSAHSAHNPISLIKHVEATPLSISNHTSTLNGKQTVLDQKYRSLIRQLPSKVHIDTLVQHFFENINWHYDIIDEIAFRQQLEAWRCIPYSSHSNAASVLPVDILTLPSLLFQLMAHALIHQPMTDGTSSIVESLKYASDMTLLDLACDFSEAGVSILEAMGKEEVTIVAVQSGILRASFLKNTGKVVEAWHVLGTTIRNAQEIGLHTEAATQDYSGSVDAQWDQEMRRRIWFVLHNWDIHMAVVLGRPMVTTTIAGSVIPSPTDCARRESGTVPRARTAQDPPTPSSVIRVAYDIAYQYFPQIRGLEDRGARMEDYNIVRETHAAIVKNTDQAPHWSRHDNPDERFDQLPGCHWLPAARQALASGIYFVLLSLHRPYIFSVAESRIQALNAALKILIVQRQLFQMTQPQHYISFNLVYPLFDAMIILLATILLFPNENLDVRSELIENVRWGIGMLSRVGECNVMARAACSIAEKLFSHLEQLGGHALHHSKTTSEGVTDRSGTEVEGLARAKACSDRGLPMGNTDAALLSPVSPQVQLEALSFPDFDFASLLPPRPVHDLFHQDILAPNILDHYQIPDFLMKDPEFEDSHTDNSFWSFMSDLNALREGGDC